MKHNKKLYAVAAVGLLLLVVTACFLPQIVFGLQDTYWSENTFLEARNGLDIQKLNISYERALKTRLSGFAEKDVSSYYVAEMSAAIDDSTYELLDSLLYQDMLLILTESMGIPIGTYEGYGIDVLKKYVVYNENYDQGIALIVWYIEYTTENGSKVRLLADAETDTIYYIDSSVAIDNAYSDVMYLRQEFLDYVNEWMYYVGDYYQSDINGEQAEIAAGLYNSENSSVVTYYNDTLPVKNRVEIPLTYGEFSLDFLVSFRDNQNGSFEYSLGILQIRDLIPELQTE